MSGQQLRLRVQTKLGPKMLDGLYLASTVGKLKETISAAADIPPHRIRLRQGYPPKIIDISNDTAELSTLPFRSGDTIIVEEDESHSQGMVPETSSSSSDDRLDTLLHHQLEEGASGILTRRVVPADNSCLFTSTHLVMSEGALDSSEASHLREVIAGIVSKDPVTYSEAFLGKPNKEYCKWIRDKNSWGGGIELSVLCQFYSTEIAVVDTQSGRVDRFGEDKNYKERVFLIYDGIHYDPLVYEAVDQSGGVCTKFSIHNAVILAQALELASEAKSVRQFTDVEGFSLRCLVCQTPLRGRKEATDHAQAMGHLNFGEY
ncbi:ubiquitin thioesterase OTU1 [Aplysia californica]|uniref:Ubiquitin thioesterase OTU n=1 Tax=Aplysia californica TaxID=6500 RepID=A0ABM0JZZ4_APLCA|nr:ubiquitin thioesterase OTU1 [Aplysia californica]XP_005105510.1 ubiquitin thioesterase OTU1 [Aplysia californica]XP_005105511.1 ubiquitin thioesterase OTU1 [Aplysia californica]XP_005105512.1 ubiquitin thioesterase OTU1 [Aplysia californica]